MRKALTLFVCTALVMGIVLHAAEKKNNKKPEVKKDQTITSHQLFGKVETLVLPPTEQKLSDVLKRKWDFSAKDKGNFTVIHAVDNVEALQGNILKFKIGKETGLLGWGNYDNKKPKKEQLIAIREIFIASVK